MSKRRIMTIGLIVVLAGVSSLLGLVVIVCPYYPRAWDTIYLGMSRAEAAELAEKEGRLNHWTNDDQTVGFLPNEVWLKRKSFGEWRLICMYGLQGEVLAIHIRYRSDLSPRLNRARNPSRRIINGQPAEL
ncbi:hypothetical protein ACXR0O_12330 [Verrucomicrobiota bacterium sgz303538]